MKPASWKLVFCIYILRVNGMHLMYYYDRK